MMLVNLSSSGQSQAKMAMVGIISRSNVEFSSPVGIKLSQGNVMGGNRLGEWYWQWNALQSTNGHGKIVGHGEGDKP